MDVHLSVTTITELSVSVLRSLFRQNVTSKVAPHSSPVSGLILFLWHQMSSSSESPVGILLSSKLYQPRKGYVAYWCPGCKTLHELAIRGEVVANDTWLVQHTDPEVPQFFPSVNLSLGHYNVRAKLKPPHCDECNDAKNQRTLSPCVRCHSWIRNGNIEFLPDSSHELSGQTVPVPKLPEYYTSPKY